MPVVLSGNGIVYLPNSGSGGGGGGTGIFDGTLKIVSGKLTNGGNTPFYARGVNLTGLEYVPIQGWDLGDITGGQMGGTAQGPNIPVMVSWYNNIARIPLNEASWLGHETFDANHRLSLADPCRNYQSTVINLVNNLLAAGIYVIIDLHWTQPGLLSPIAQAPMANMTNSVPFFTSIANIFGVNASGGSISGLITHPGGVAFEGFNEPFIGGGTGGASSANWVTLMQGGRIKANTFNQMSLGSGTYQYNGANLYTLDIQPTSPGIWFPGDTITQGANSAVVQAWDTAQGQIYYSNGTTGGTITPTSFTTGAITKTAGAAGIPLISRSLTPIVSSGTAANLNSANYNNSCNFTGGAGEYAGYNFSTQVATGSTTFLLCWYGEWPGNYAFAYDSVDVGASIFNCPSGYYKEISQDGTNWLTLGAVISTTRSAGQELFQLTGGYKYARLRFTGVNGGTSISLKMDAYDVTYGVSDGTIYMGDALTNYAMAHLTINYGTVNVEAAPNMAAVGGFILTLGAITSGSGYTNGVYPQVYLTGGTGTTALARITVSGGAVTAVALEGPGWGYTAGDVLTTANTNIGGTGSGFTVAVSTIQGPGYYATNPYYPAIDAGQSGWGSADWVNYLTNTYKTFFQDFKGRKVVITIGTIDAEPASTVSTAQYYSNMTTIINLAIAANKLVYLCTIPFSFQSDVTPYNTQIANLLSAYPQWVKAGPDWYAWTFANQDLIFPLPDGIHTTDPARAAWRQKMVAFECAQTNTASANVTVLNQGYAVAGHQQLLNAIRATGAKNVYIAGGLEYCNNLSQWLANVPTDSATQMCVAWHRYPPQSQVNAFTIVSGGSGYAVNDIVSFPFPLNNSPVPTYFPLYVQVTAVSGGAVTAANIYNTGHGNQGGLYLQSQQPSNPLTASTTDVRGYATTTGSGLQINVTNWGNQSSTWSNLSNEPAVASIVAAGYPLLMTESGEYSYPGMTGSLWTTYIEKYLDSFTPGTSGVTWWSWYVNTGPSADTLLYNSAGTPTPGFGAIVQAWQDAHSVGATSMVNVGHSLPIYATNAGTYGPTKAVDPTDYYNSYNSTGDPVNIDIDISSCIIATDSSGYRGLVYVWSTPDETFQPQLQLLSPADIPGNYTIQTNSAAGGGAPPASGWVTAHTETSNVVARRAHLINVAGVNWVRLAITQQADGSTSGSNLHIELWNAAGAMDSTHSFVNAGWFMLGDSIYANGMMWGPPGGTSNPPVSSYVNTQLGIWPLQFCASFPGWTTANVTPYIAGWLAQFPGRFIQIGLGTNDIGAVTPAQFGTNLQTLVTACQSAGKLCLIDTVPWGTFAPVTTIQSYNAYVTSVIAANPGVAYPGVDRYTYLFNNQSLISGDGKHPVAAGYTGLRTLQASLMASFAGGA